MVLKRNKGFSLVELIVIIFILGVVFSICGYFVVNTIKNSKEQSNKIAINNIKNASRFFVEENSENLLWLDELGGIKYSCVFVNELINKDYLHKNEIKNFDGLTDYIIVRKDINGNIVSEKLDNGNICSNENKVVLIPDSDKFCKKNLFYSGNEQIVTNDGLINDDFYFEDNIYRDAGNYDVKVKLMDSINTYWEDGTYKDKIINCSIKKSNPSLVFNTDDLSDISVDKSINFYIKSSVDGKIEIKSDNASYYDIIVDTDNNIYSNVDKKVIVNVLASRNIEGNITITLVPNDTNNYNVVSKNVTIGKSVKKAVKIPTSKDFCEKNYYNNSSLNLLKKELEGVTFYNTVAEEIGEYEVVAKLNYGYYWKGTNNDTSDKTFVCSIDKPKVEVSYDSVGGSDCSKKEVTYLDEYGELCEPTKKGYSFDGWYSKLSEGEKINADVIVDKYYNHTIYARWVPNIYKITYKANGGTGDDYTETITYNENYVTWNNWYTAPTGRNFNGWNEKKNGSGTSWTDWINKEWKWTYDRDVVLYAQWIDNIKPNCWVSKIVSNSTNGRAVTLECDEKVATLNLNYKYPDHRNCRDTTSDYNVNNTSITLNFNGCGGSYKLEKLNFKFADMTGNVSTVKGISSISSNIIKDNVTVGNNYIQFGGY